MTVKVSMKPGDNHREEVWAVVSGEDRAVVDGRQKPLTRGDVLTIPAGSKHMVEAVTALDLVEVAGG